MVSPVQTAVGNFGGGLKDIPAAELGATVITAVLERTGLAPDKIDEVILGQGYSGGEEPAIGRLGALQAGLPIEGPGYQWDRRCSSGLQAILNASMMVQTGHADVVLAGGVERMSRVEVYTMDMRSGSRLGSVTLHDRLTRARATASPEERFGVISGMIETAENVAARDRSAREAQDAYALRRHQCAVAALESGTCADEIVPVLIPQRRGAPIRFQVDEGPRKETSLEALATLRPLTSGGSVTAGNASAQNDAAAVCLVMAGDQLEALGLPPMAFLRGWVVAGVHPAYMGMGPVPAVAKVLARTRLTWDDIDLIELTEGRMMAAMLRIARASINASATAMNWLGSGLSYRRRESHTLVTSHAIVRHNE